MTIESNVYWMIDEAIKRIEECARIIRFNNAIRSKMILDDVKIIREGLTIIKGKK